MLVKGLVLVSGSHGERCLPLAVMLLILILRRGCPEAQDTSWAAQRRGAKMALCFASVLHTASGLFLTAKSLRAALKQLRGLASLRCTAFTSGYNLLEPAEEFRAAAVPVAANF